MGIGVNIMQPHPHTQIAQCACEFGHAGFQWLAAPKAGAVFDVDTVGAGVLRNHQQFLYTCFHQIFCFLHHLANRAAHQIATHRRNDAEGATVIAALSDFEIGVVIGGELDADITRGRHQINVWIVFVRQMLVHRAHHLIGGVRTGDGEHFRVGLFNDIALRTETAGDDDPAVFGECFADRIQ